MLELEASDTTFDPAMFIQKGWSIYPEDQLVVEAPLDVDMQMLVLRNMFRDGEKVLDSETRLHRHREAGNRCLGATHFFRLWNHQDQIPEGWKRRDEGKDLKILFDATILRRADGHRGILYLHWFADREWHWYYHWFAEELYPNNQSVVLEG